MELGLGKRTASVLTPREIESSARNLPARDPASRVKPRKKKEERRRKKEGVSRCAYRIIAFGS